MNIPDDGSVGPSRDSVKVVCRVRPSNDIELSRGGVDCVKFARESIEVEVDDGVFSFTYDNVFSSRHTQENVFDFTARPIVGDVLQGYNCTIFAYGQTSSGKTYTMEGPSIFDEELKGVIPRSVEALFEGVKNADEDLEFTMKISFVEIYMEKIRDLLDAHHVKTDLKIREDKKSGIYVAGVTEEYVASKEELLELMAEGASNRAVAATGMNEGSSRSHSVFTITVSQRNVKNNSMTHGKLVLVDLAGSEMVRKTHASGQQLEEAKTINKSLSALGLVINALTDSSASHVPYRDSKLTRMLQDSLGGNSKTALIINVSPSSYNANETLSTLRFGARAKRIHNKAIVNQTRSVEELEALLKKAETAIEMQQTYIAALEAQLSEARQAGFAGETPAPELARALSGDSGERSPGRRPRDQPDAPFAHRSGGERKEAAGSGLASPSRRGTATARQESTGSAWGGPDEMQDSAGGDGRGRGVSERSEQQTGEAPSDMATTAVVDGGLGRVVAQLQEKVTSLAQELEEEHEETSRLQTENEKLSALLSEKERHLTRASDLMAQAKKHYSAQRERADTLMAEKASTLAEAESLKALVEEMREKSKFEADELRLTIETLQTENDHLATEIEQLSGDKAPRMREFAAGGVAGEGSAQSAAGANAPLGAGTTPTGGGLTAAGRRSTVALGDAATLEGISVQVTTIEETIETDRTLIEDMIVQYQGVLPALFVRKLREHEGKHAGDKRSLANSVIEARQDVQSVRAEYQQRLREHDNQRLQLTNDLQSRQQQLVELQENLDRASTSNEAVMSIFSANEQLHLRSVQQRLEQLVAVHRQLLRKYAALELETSESRKKIQRRDQRIAQLETNSRFLAANMRTQAERHVAELNSLREQVAEMRTEHEQRMEAAKHAGHIVHQPGAVRRLRGGGGGEVKSLRGGGRKLTSIMGGGTAVPTGNGAPSPKRGFVSRLMGGRSKS